MAVGNVSATITIKGQDQASAAINKAGASAKGLSNSLDAAQKKAQGLGGAMRQMASGDVIGGLRGLSGAMGAGAGLAGSAALAAAGIAGIAVALGAAAVKATEWSIEVERMRAQMRFAFGADGEKRALALADAIGGVTVESVVKLQAALKMSGAEGSLTVEQLQRVTNAATAMGKTGDEALTALSEAIKLGNTRALKQTGIFINGAKAMDDYADSVGKSKTELTAAEMSQATINAVMAEIPGLAQAGTDVYARQDTALSNLSNTWTKYKLELSDFIAKPALEVIKYFDALFHGVVLLEKMVWQLVRIPFVASFEGWRLITEAVSAAMAGEFVKSAELASDAMLAMPKAAFDAASEIARLATESTDAGNAQGWLAQMAEAANLAISAQSGKIGGLAYAADLFNKAARTGAADQVKYLKGQVAIADQRKKAAQAAASQRAKAEADRKKEVGAEFMAGVGADTEAGAARANEIRLEEARALLDNASALEAHRDRVLGVYASIAADPASAAIIERQQIEIQLAKDLMAVQLDQALTSGQRATESAALQVQANAQIRASVDAVTEAQNAQIQAQLGTASTAASAVKTLVGVFAGEEVAKRAAAGVDAAIETARAIASFAAQDYVGGAMHAASAIAFGKVALTSPTVPSAGGSGPSQAKPAAESGGGGGGTTVINLHGIMTTKAEVGAAIGKALASAKPTGMVPA